MMALACWPTAEEDWEKVRQRGGSNEIENVSRNNSAFSRVT
jgi:hypothetical protein